jgi:hypothetical protein
MTESEFKLIDKRFDTIEKLIGGVNTRLDNLNGKVYKHEEVINEAIGERKSNREAQTKVADKVDELDVRTNLLEKESISHFINCPISKDVRNLLDDNLSNKSIKKFMSAMFMGGVALGGLIIGLLKLILG